MDVMSVNTIQEREHLYTPVVPKRYGFTPRRVEKLTQLPLPRTMVNIECNHFLRTSREESAHDHKTIEYQLWLEAGKHNPPFPKMADSNYNSNVWRNFKKNFSFNLNTAGRSVSESAAIAHPIAIPKPSKVGDYTFNRFIRETPALIKDERVRSIATCRTAVDEHMMEQLKIKSYNRYPPIDVNGNIIAPEHYKKHPHYFKPIANLPTTEYLVAQLKMAPPSPYGYHESPFKYTPKKSPAWRFNLKSSNSNYQKALAEIRRYSEEPASREPSVGTRVKTCTPATSTAPSEIL